MNDYMTVGGGNDEEEEALDSNVEDEDQEQPEADEVSD